jgi:hypothetical protein
MPQPRRQQPVSALQGAPATTAMFAEHPLAGVQEAPGAELGFGQRRATSSMAMFPGAELGFGQRSAAPSRAQASALAMPFTGCNGPNDRHSSLGMVHGGAGTAGSVFNGGGFGPLGGIGTSKCLPDAFRGPGMFQELDDFAGPSPSSVAKRQRALWERSMVSDSKFEPVVQPQTAPASASRCAQPQAAAAPSIGLGASVSASLAGTSRFAPPGVGALGTLNASTSAAGKSSYAARWLIEAYRRSRSAADSWPGGCLADPLVAAHRNGSVS